MESLGLTLRILYYFPNCENARQGIGEVRERDVRPACLHRGASVGSAAYGRPKSTYGMIAVGEGVEE